MLATVRHRVRRLLGRRDVERSDDATGATDRLAEESPALAGIASGSTIAGPIQSARRSAGDLAEDPVASASVTQGDGRTQLCLRQIREWERNEDYPAG